MSHRFCFARSEWKIT